MIAALAESGGSRFNVHLAKLARDLHNRYIPCPSNITLLTSVSSAYHKAFSLYIASGYTLGMNPSKSIVTRKVPSRFTQCFPRPVSFHFAHLFVRIIYFA